MQIQLEEGGFIELPEGSLAEDLIQKLHLTAPDQGLGVSIQGKLRDLSHPLNDRDTVRFWNFSDREGKEIFWHTSAHILAQAVLRLWPQAKPTIGPPLAEGFYYDFADLHITEEDFPKIEKQMQEIIQENYKTVREVFPNKAAALKAFGHNQYKQELIKEFEEQAPISAYRQAEFYDLCRGPHLPLLGKVKAVKVLKTSGAYWRGDASREMLTRIYAITFPEKKMLKEYLHRLEEARKRDHKIIGPKLGIFSLKEEAPGMPFIHPRGMIIWNALLNYWRECHKKYHYQEIKTPVLLSRELWERSGHWEHYRQHMYTSAVEERIFSIKPMNCPGCMLYYASDVHSYREFPLRIAEIGQVHRHEPSGALSGLMRVRSFHQDDAHLFLEKHQIEEEILHIFALMEEMYQTFSLSFELELSTRPEKGTIGSDIEWEEATRAMKNALEKTGKPYRINEGEGAFYGPKIDVHIRDALGRMWQCSTIQLDMALPQKFQLEYVDQKGARERPIMIHRVVYGSIERFLGVLIEHFSGKFPLWLSPRPVIFIPVADRHVAAAQNLAKKMQAEEFLCEVDVSHESVSKKIRRAQLMQFNYMVTIGDQEMQEQTLSLRTRDNVVHRGMTWDPFLNSLRKERETKALFSPFSQKESSP